MTENLAERIAATRKEIDSLKSQIAAQKKELNDRTLQQVATDVAALNPKSKLRQRRTLKGHLAKIYAMGWVENKQDHHLVSASQDAKLLVWDTINSNKINCVPLQSAWVMCCAISSTRAFTACGGLDNTCTIFHMRSRDQPIRPSRLLSGHNGFISSCKFLPSERQVLTGAGDNNCILWDVEAGTAVTTFQDHQGEVMSVALNPLDSNTFVSGSADATNKIWDMRTGKSVQTFEGHESDVNSVAFFPNGQAIASGADDSTCKLFDIRADRELYTFGSEQIVSGVTSVAFSLSGRLLFAGYDDYNIHVWDVLRGEKAYTLQGHENRVSCLGVSADGAALATGSWDTLLRVWA
mmetsp:Transcript_27286/g.38464  ORF Transcript_27286/g.38464 Transcript_27286/m.38464 type:complete len:351 (-) Transcript_27286:62-1114(-)|eukprot:CAMPEP_0168556540 /NCGR_PEP_ID=MMETSP0413-20121227/8938_1 /TAXON_ID=136452 /ORGANISM="Filamoeba nolandi, Strain NC-AS-23-1" /LENGTH=350 /DNA_ID=CAMNT_0008587495 /DNA_START=39 /DNA_END=1091 /DNA_ORIENTATION=-